MIEKMLAFCFMGSTYCATSDAQQRSFDQQLLAKVFAKYFRKLTKD